jgi:hypothetical protein
VNEHVFAASILLDEAKALVCVEKLNGALALANDLSGHAATAATTRSATAEAATAATWAAAEATAITAAEAATTTAAAAAKTVATATETIAAAKAVTAAHERVETFFSETVPLVAPPATTSSIETHKT